MKPTRDKDKDSNNSRCISVHIHTLHQRLLHALNLGTRYFDEKTKTWKWQCPNIEVQKNVLRSINAFLDSISGDTRATRHSIVKDCVSDVLGALLWILECKSGPLLSMASNVAVKLVSVLPNSLLQSRILDLVCCLSSLLSSHQVEVAVACANALNLVVSNLSATSEKAVIEVLKEREISVCIVGNIKDFARGVNKIEYFEQMASFLSTILWRWPQSRFPVWNDVKLMKALADMHTTTDSSIKLVLLKVYTSLALCDSVAKKLIEGGVFVEMVVQAMGKSNPHVVRIEGFKLAQCLLRSQENCLKVMDLCGEALVEAIICGMRETGLSSKKVGTNHGSLLMESFQLGLITRWAGDHHISFWKQGIDRVLLNLLIGNIQDQSSEHVLSLEEQVSTAKEGLNSNYHLGLRSYLWDILGWLTIHCGENFNPYTYGSELHINTLITCACLTFVDTIQKWCRICQKDVDDNFQSEPVSRAVLMMIYSPCNYISSQARDVILEAETNELVGWTCNICSNSVPHLHVHKVILQSGCDYLRGLFRSGMRESHSQVIKVAISWEALIKLVHWFYSNELPIPPSGCLWDNMDDEEKLSNLQPYVELNWLAEFWILESIQEACWNVIISCLDSAKHLSAKIIKMAYNLSSWKLVDIAANLMAPSYRQLRDSGELEEFDDPLVHLIYSASIRLAQEGGNCSR